MHSKVFFVLKPKTSYDMNLNIIGPACRRSLQYIDCEGVEFYGLQKKASVAPFCHPWTTKNCISPVEREKGNHSWPALVPYKPFYGGRE